LYEPGTKARSFLENIRKELYLINVVDNNYIDGNLFELLDEI